MHVCLTASARFCLCAAQMLPAHPPHALHYVSGDPARLRMRPRSNDAYIIGKTTHRRLNTIAPPFRHPGSLPARQNVLTSYCTHPADPAKTRTAVLVRSTRCILHHPSEFHEDRQPATTFFQRV
ncbi:hypothetical protein B0H14DRAFT_2586734 [Mycena olivaceomarginata]|nr:hypothetical protein B0H14DRAFT_2586734 [Mycena olivaceomarginata]